jgi:hypothetical protein
LNALLDQSINQIIFRHGEHNRGHKMPLGGSHGRSGEAGGGGVMKAKRKPRSKPSVIAKARGGPCCPTVIDATEDRLNRTFSIMVHAW